MNEDTQVIVQRRADPIAVIMILLLTVLYIGILVEGGQALNSALFVQQEMCDVGESVSRGCSNEIGLTRSTLECVVLCWRDAECVGASLDSQGMCLHHRMCHSSVPCSSVSMHRYMEPFCLHGTWDSPSKSCTCHFGTFGERCKKYHSSCYGFLGSGFPDGGHLVIMDPLQDGTTLVKVKVGIHQPSYCNVHVFINTGRLNFNRTWAEYVNGFRRADDVEDFWLGLRPWYFINKFELKKLTSMIVFKSGGKLFNVYHNMELSEDGGEYYLNGQFQWSGSGGGSSPPGGHAGDCLGPLQGLQFSTWDRDRDGNVGVNCASVAGSGWWYNASCGSPCQWLVWGLDQYQATPPAQRLAFRGVDVDRDFALIDKVFMYLENN